MSDIVPITIPMTIESTETTVQMDMQDVVAPVQIDFTASAVTLPAGSDATVEYGQKHFTFGIPKGESGGGGGAVDSVNGKTGAVVLDAEDVGAGTYSKPSGGIPKTDLASAVQTSLGKADSAYQKPSGGIPSTDMSSAVQTSLGKADTALQSVPSTYRTASAQDAIDETKEDKVTEVTVSSTGAVTQALDAGKIYHFTGSLTSLTITLNAAATGQIPQYHFDFISGSTAVTLTMPNTVVMPDSFTVEANKRYEVDILNGYGAVMEWAN